jgi:hypothetical protein
MLERPHDQLDVPTRAVPPASDPQPRSAPRHTSGIARAGNPVRVAKPARRESEALQDAIGHPDGKAEWGVKVFTDFTGAGGRTQNVDAGAGDATGAAYMERIRTERELRDRAIEVAEVAAAQIHDRLTAVVVDAQAIPLQRPEVSGHSGEMILNGVYLVADVAAAAFHEQVEALRSEFEPHGIEIGPTGPWPAYNFVSGTIGAAW